MPKTKNGNVAPWLMHWKALLSAVILLGSLGVARAADPMTFKEISMLLRNGEQQQEVLDEASRRKLLEPLSPQQASELSAMGATPAFLNALRSPALLATPAMVAAYKVHMQERAAVQNSEDSTPPPPVVVPAQQAVVDHFTESLKAAQTARPIAVGEGDAFTLAQLEQAKARAVEQKKPLGFIMVWGQFYGKRVSNRSIGSEAAFVHFYQSFNDSLVLVFVRHETDLDSVPPAVRQGFYGPDEGGFAPNMAVVDATASEFIVEIPMGGGNSDGAKRDPIFSAGAAQVDQWLARHPAAVATPARP